MMMMMMIVTFLYRVNANLSCEKNRGVFYEEDLAIGLEATCECHQCYVDDRCETLRRIASVDVTTVEMSFGREFFEGKSEIDISSAYHLDYLDNPTWLYGSTNRISSKLNETIRKLHDRVGNLPEPSSSYQLVVGAGAMQLLTASVASLAKLSNASSCDLAVQRPYWGEFQDIATALSPRVRWYDNSQTEACTIEIVTSPNNPNGKLCEPKFNTSLEIFDYVYNWLLVPR